MSAFQLGPFVLSAPRFYAAVGLLVMVASAWVAARRLRRAGEGPAEDVWAWNAALAVVVGARIGFVVENLAQFMRQPLAIVQFWQGGFSPWWGVVAGAVVAASSLRGRGVTLPAVLAPALLGLAAWLLLPALLSPASASDQRLPELALERLEGGEFDLAALRGQPVVVNLWATWCPPCRRELPMLAAAAAANPDVRFVFADQAEPRSAVAAYLAARDELELEGVVLDSRARLGAAFGSVGLPTTLFFDAEGKHVLTHAGELSAVLLANHLAALARDDH